MIKIRVKRLQNAQAFCRGNVDGALMRAGAWAPQTAAPRALANGDEIDREPVADQERREPDEASEQQQTVRNHLGHRPAQRGAQHDEADADDQEHHDERMLQHVVAERPLVGKLVNEIKRELESRIAALQDNLRGRELERSLGEAKLDVTLPGTKIPRGRIHPITPPHFEQGGL